eukprot:3763780-Rhodomonas_salina.1
MASEATDWPAQEALKARRDGLKARIEKLKEKMGGGAYRRKRRKTASDEGRNVAQDSLVSANQKLRACGEGLGSRGGKRRRRESGEGGVVCGGGEWKRVTACAFMMTGTIDVGRRKKAAEAAQEAEPHYLIVKSHPLTCPFPPPPPPPPPPPHVLFHSRLLINHSLPVLSAAPVSLPFFTTPVTHTRSLSLSLSMSLLCLCLCRCRCR